MAEEGRWKRLADQLNTPWDWAFAGAGAAGGYALSALVWHADGGTAIPAGAAAGVSSKQAVFGLFKSPVLKKRTSNLRRIIEEWTELAKLPRPNSCRQSLDLDADLWKRGLLSNAQFERLLDKHIDMVRRLADKPVALLPSAVSPPSSGLVSTGRAPRRRRASNIDDKLPS